MEQNNPTTTDNGGAAATAAPATDAGAVNTTATGNTGETSQNTPASETAAETTQPSGAPEQYAAFEVPDGVVMDTEMLGEFMVAAKDIGLKQEQAQHLVTMGATLAQRITENAALAEAARIAAWEAETRNDKEIGGEQLDANLSLAKRAMEAFGSDALMNVLNETGLGNHPAIIKAFVKAGKAISEDTLMPGGAQVPAEKKSLAQTLYPHMNP